MDNSINRFGFNRTLDSPSNSLTKFNESRANNYLNYPQSKFYNGHRQTKYHQLNSDEIDFRPHNQVRRVQSFTIGNKNLDSRLFTNYSSCNKSFALSGCASGSNSSAILQHTVSFRKSPNVDLVLAKLRHLHRRPAIAAREKQLYKQQQLQKIQQLNESKLQSLNLDNDNNDNQESTRFNETEINDQLKNEEISDRTVSKDNNQKQQDNSSSGDKTSNEDKKNQITNFMKNHGSKLNKTKDSNSMEALSPTLPAIWLKNQEQHFMNKVANLKKGGSLPRNFEACL